MIDAGRIPVIAIAEPIKCGLGYPVLDPLIAVPENASDKSYVLDAVDLRLYVLLLEDGLRCFSELASLVSMSDLMARRRIDALRERGCLRFATLFEHYLLRYDVECVCGYVSNSRNSRGQEGPSPIDKKCVTFPP